MHDLDVRAEIQPLLLILVIALLIHLIKQNVPIFPILAGAISAIGIFAATWYYLGRRFLKAAACFSMSALWFGISKYLQSAHDTALILAEKYHDPFALTDLTSDVFYYNQGITLTVWVLLLCTGFWLFRREC